MIKFLLFVFVVNDCIYCNVCRKECTQSNGVYAFPPSSKSLTTNYEPIFIQTDCKHFHNIVFPSWTLLNITEKKQSIKKSAPYFPWEKKKPILFFRGRDTDHGHYHDFMENYSKPWFPHPRTHLVGLFLAHPDCIDARLSGVCGRIELPGHEINYVSLENHCEYKYLMDLDGTCASNPRNLLILFTGSLVFKVLSNSLAFQDACLKPYVHFIPIKHDLSDILSKLEWAKKHDKKCKKIADNGRKLADVWFSKDYLDLYIYRLIEAYANKQEKYYSKQYNKRII